jgi:uncharacterized membrane protein YhhN
VIRNAALGSVAGVAVGLLGYAQQAAGFTDSSTRISLGLALGAVALLGPVMSLTLMATKSWRTDLVGHYASWIVAGMVAGLTMGGVILLDDPTTPAMAFGFSAFLGLCGGLGLGAFFRVWGADDRSPRE